MPPSKPPRGPGWIYSDQLTLPRQTLSPAEVQPFLEYLFSSVARKPKQLKLKETAGVVRYLKALAWKQRESSEQDLIERIADIIWGTLLQSGQIAIAGKSQVILFLQQHRSTYLRHFEVENMLELIRACKEPGDKLFRVPNLLGRTRSVSGSGPARLQDDLTERIYVGYYALRRAKVRNARGQIVQVLRQLGFQTRPRSATVGTWGPAEISERLRQFEAKMIRQQRLSQSENRSQEIIRLRDTRVNGWVHGFRQMYG